MSRIFLVFPLLFILGIGLFGQTPIRDLNEALSSGDLTLSANGRGSSSGFSVDGYLTNNTSREIRINVIINDSLYLSNIETTSQNMIAIQVYLASGGYSTTGGNYFISIPQNSRAVVIFRAFCANFDKDNPKTTNSFRVASVPSDLRAIMSRINRYMVDNFDDDTGLTKAVQLALWRTQNLTRTRITSTFNFSDSDWEIASRIMNY